MPWPLPSPGGANQGDVAAARAYLEALLAEEKARDHSKTYPFLAIHVAQFLRKHAGDVEGARKVCVAGARTCAWAGLGAACDILGPVPGSDCLAGVAGSSCCPVCTQW